MMRLANQNSENYLDPRLYTDYTRLKRTYGINILIDLINERGIINLTKFNIAFGQRRTCSKRTGILGPLFKIHFELFST